MMKTVTFIIIFSLPVIALAEDKFSGPYGGMQLGYIDAKDKGK